MAPLGTTALAPLPSGGLQTKTSTTAKPTRSMKNTAERSTKPSNKNASATVEKPRSLKESKVSTPKSKENKPAATPGSVTKRPKTPSWKRRPKAAHSGVPVPEKMRKLLAKCLQEDAKL